MSNFLIADDHDIVVTGLSLMIRPVYPGSVIDFAKDGQEVYEKIKKKKVIYDILITDIDMPGTSIHELVKWVKVSQPKCRILVFSMHREEIYARQLFKIGVDGYVSKSQDKESILNAIRLVLSGKKYYNEKVIQIVSSYLFKERTDNPFSILSERELEIMMYLINRKTVAEICNLANLHNSTVSTYKSRIFEKLEVTNLLDLRKLYDEFHQSL